MKENKNIKILVVEDEDDIRELIHFHLYRQGYQVIEAARGDDAWDILEKEKVDLALLDIMIPGISGLELCQKICSRDNLTSTKIIFLSAKGEEEDIVHGLELGADDYIAKPFAPKILLARVQAVLRRKSESRVEVTNLSHHGLEVDDKRKKISSEGEELKLTATEYQLLSYFISSPGHVFTRNQLVNHIRGHNHAITDRSIDTQVVSLRKKLKDKGQLIETVWGVGYCMREEQ